PPLVAELVVDGLPAHPGGGRDVPHPEAPVAALHEEGGGGVEQGLAHGTAGGAHQSSFLLGDREAASPPDHYHPAARAGHGPPRPVPPGDVPPAAHRPAAPARPPAARLSRVWPSREPSRGGPVGGILVANRGEVALRIVRAAAELGLRTVAVRTRDEAVAAYARRADEVRELPGEGAAGYLDADALIAAAKDAGAAAVHPGYGFLSEDAAFAARCAAAGLAFAGPRPELLELFGDKTRARALAADAGVPVPPGTAGPATLAEAAAVAREHGPVMLKAVAGGGGRGMRVVADPAGMAAAYERCRSEALASFGSGDLYAEKHVPRARHIEVQIAGDGTGAAVHLWERDCSVQRRHQKLIEVAPAPALPRKVRDALLDAALRMASRVRYDGIGTFEFLVAGEEYWFLEANPRLQAEHTVTEEITGVDLVKTQIRLALGEDLAAVGLGGGPPRASGCAVQVRVNAETIDADGAPHPRAGTLTAFAPPSGPGVRVDTCGHVGHRTSPRYDPLLAKVVARAEDLPSAAARAHGALGEFEIAGVPTSIPLLQGVLRHPDFTSGAFDTSFLADHLPELLDSEHRSYYVETVRDDAGVPAPA